jgi:hypothetical protein
MTDLELLQKIEGLMDVEDAQKALYKYNLNKKYAPFLLTLPSLESATVQHLPFR